MFQATIGNKLVIEENEANTWTVSNDAIDKFIATMDDTGSICPRAYVISNMGDDTYHIRCAEKTGYVDRYPTIHSKHPLDYITHQELYCMTTLIDLYRVDAGGRLILTTVSGTVNIVRLDK